LLADDHAAHQRVLGLTDLRRQTLGVAAPAAATAAAALRRGQLGRERVDVLLHRIERRLHVRRHVVARPERRRQPVQLPRQRRVRRRGLAHATLQRVHLHRHVVLALALGRREHDFRIVVHAQRLRIDRLAVGDQLDLVVARGDVRAGRVVAEAESAAATALALDRAARAERTGLLILILVLALLAAATLTGAGAAGRTCPRRSSPADWMRALLLLAIT